MITSKDYQSVFRLACSVDIIVHFHTLNKKGTSFSANLNGVIIRGLRAKDYPPTLPSGWVRAYNHRHSRPVTRHELRRG